MKHVLERRINKANINPVPDIILIDGGKLQLKADLSTFSNLIKDPPIILSIVKGSKRVRSTAPARPVLFLCIKNVENGGIAHGKDTDDQIGTHSG